MKNRVVADFHLARLPDGWLLGFQEQAPCAEDRAINDTTVCTTVDHVVVSSETASLLVVWALHDQERGLEYSMLPRA